MHPFRFGIQCRGPADPAGWRALARKVEDLGWSTLTIADHFDDALAPIPALMAAADATTTLRVGTMVLGNDYRHPVVVAKEAATLDVLTGGRFELGIGAGWMTVDYEAAGIPLDRAGMRVSRLDEAVRCLKGLWSGGRSRSGRRTTGSTASTASRCPDPRRPAHRDRRRRAARAGLAGGRRRGRPQRQPHGGVIDERPSPTAPRRPPMAKIGWVREAAAGRADDVELQVRVHLAMVTHDRAAVVDDFSPAFRIVRGGGGRHAARGLVGTSTTSASSCSSVGSAGGSGLRAVGGPARRLRPRDRSDRRPQSGASPGPLSRSRRRPCRTAPRCPRRRSRRAHDPGGRHAVAPPCIAETAYKCTSQLH